jgi:ATP/maltotriose-dependent transcriptional regulator MalT
MRLRKHDGSTGTTAEQAVPSSSPGSTKIAAPHVGEAHPRPRAFALLDRARERPAIWIGAPAGTGKSTLVASYAAARGLRCVWYEVDARDRDPASLFYYLGRAVDTHWPGGVPLPVLTSDPGSPALGFSRRFFEAVFARMDRQAVLVFDGCEAIEDGDRWYDFVRAGIEAVPRGVNVLFTSRAPPAPALARLVAASRVALVGWDDVRFSPDESAALVRARSARLGLSVTSDEIARLHAESDGWAAGLVLAIECARVEPGPPRVGAPGSRQQIFNYFATELLARVDADLAGFMTKTAHLPYMTGVAVDRLLGVTGAVERLHRLESQNLFVRELAVSPPTYRYHPLLRQFLVARAETQLAREELDRLRRNAATILAGQGDVEGAFSVLDLTADAATAADLVAAAAPMLAQQGRMQTILDWVAHLPEELPQSRPWLAFWTGVGALGSQPTRALSSLQSAMDGFAAAGDDTGYWHAWCGMTQGLLLAGDDLRDASARVMRAVEPGADRRPFPSDEVEAKVTRCLALFLAVVALGEPAANEWLERALALPRAQDPTELAIAAMTFGISGDTRRLVDVVEPWRRRLQREEVGAVARLTLMMAEMPLAMQRGEMTTGHEIARAGFELAERCGVFLINASLRAQSAYLSIALGDLATLTLVLDEMGDAVAEHDRALDRANYHAIASRVALLEGDVARSLVQAELGMTYAERLPWVADCIHRLALAEAQWRSGRTDDARAEVERVRRRAQGAYHSAYQSALLLEAAMLRETGDTDELDARLDEALALGARYGFVPLLGPLRDTLAPLCARALERGIASDYVARIVESHRLELRVERAARSPSSEAPGATVPREFARTVRAALRGLHETRKLAQSRLLETRFVSERAGADAPDRARVEALHEILCESVRALARTAPAESMYRALLHTYLEPMPTQLLAAEAAGMSFGTYRRHLAAATEEIATALWLREQALAR